MRQKKNKCKRQEHGSFIDWIIAMPAKITIIGHQIELKMNQHTPEYFQFKIFKLDF
jgi:hypothetical protein